MVVEMFQKYIFIFNIFLSKKTYIYIQSKKYFSLVTILLFKENIFIFNQKIYIFFRTKTIFLFNRKKCVQ